MGLSVYGALTSWDIQFMGNSVHGTFSSLEVQPGVRDSTVFAIRHPSK